MNQWTNEMNNTSETLNEPMSQPPEMFVFTHFSWTDATGCHRPTTTTLDQTLWRLERNTTKPIPTIAYSISFYKTKRIPEMESAHTIWSEQNCILISTCGTSARTQTTYTLVGKIIDQNHGCITSPTTRRLKALHAAKEESMHRIEP